MGRTQGSFHLSSVPPLITSFVPYMGSHDVGALSGSLSSVLARVPVWDPMGVAEGPRHIS